MEEEAAKAREALTLKKQEHEVAVRAAEQAKEAALRAAAGEKAAALKAAAEEKAAALKAAAEEKAAAVKAAEEAARGARLGGYPPTTSSTAAVFAPFSIEGSTDALGNFSHANPLHKSVGRRGSSDLSPGGAGDAGDAGAATGEV